MRLMLLRDLRHRITRHLTPQTPEQTRRTAAEARHDRASAVVDLQQEVRRPQRAIAELSRPDQSGPDPSTDARLSALQADLERAQRDPARFQGRIEDIRRVRVSQVIASIHEIGQGGLAPDPVALSLEQMEE